MNRNAQSKALAALSVIPSQTFTIIMFAKAYRRVNHVTMHKLSTARILRNLTNLGYIEIIDEFSDPFTPSLYRECRTHH